MLGRLLVSAAPTSGAPPDVPLLVDLLLDEQKTLSAVERFAQRHEEAEIPLQARYYSDMIPTGLPEDGQQFAFRVDLDACTGCKACVTACNGLNGLGSEETWRDVGLLVGGRDEDPVLQTVTTACHHCEDPGCLSGCPVLAYEKDPVTGIVRHLDDQCIGCQYCVLKCPYEVPKFDSRLGIVRKCDMCSGRLAASEAPACVQGCPNEAISIEIVEQEAERPETLLPLVPYGMPHSSHTRPTTRYVTRHGDPQADAIALRPVDYDAITSSPGHTPLAFMLVAIQLSVGMLLCGVLLSSLALQPEAVAVQRISAVLAAGVALAGQAGAFLHLGRPRYAFRAVLGWRTSWMSREILALGAYMTFVATHAASGWAAPLALELGVPERILGITMSLLVAAASIAGLVGIFTSVMVYADTHRAFWSLPRSAFRFFGSTLVLGPPAVLVCAFAAVSPARLADQRSLDGVIASLCGLMFVTTLFKLGGEWFLLRPLHEAGLSTLKRSAMLVLGPLRKVWRKRIVLGVAGGLVAPAAMVWLLTDLNAGSSGSGADVTLLPLASIAFGALLVGEFLERHLFFRAESARAMPGSA